MGVFDPNIRTVAAYLAWVPLTVFFCWRFGARRGVLIGWVAGHILLPSTVHLQPPLKIFSSLSKLDAIGAGIGLGVLCMDFKTLRRFRLHWLDLPVLAYLGFPLTGIAIGGPIVYWDVADFIARRFVEFVIPYVAGRLYFSDAEGAARIASAFVVGSLLMVPVCAFEAIMGPPWYLGPVVYVLSYKVVTVNRLGGWRPETLMMNGGDVATWMALGAVLSLWLWLGRSWKPRWGPAWWPPLVLILTEIAVRGVFGYITLVLGLIAAVLTQTLRTRWVIVALALVAPAYIGSRLSGDWDAQVLVQISENLVGRGSTIAYRLNGENETFAKLLPGHVFLGVGGSYWNPDLFGPPVGHYPHGWWTMLFFEGGVVGVILHFLPQIILPVGLALSHPAGRPDRRAASSPSWGLALFLVLVMDDCLLNHTYIATGLIAGTLVGRGIARGPTAGRRRAPGSVSDGGRARGESSVPGTVPIVAGLACLLYVFGHGPVAGQETFKLIGGLGAALLFAVAGWAGAWASGKFPLRRVVAFGLLFAALGTSFNLFIHPTTRPVWSADILQGLALCGVAVACWRRVCGDSPWADSVLAIGSLIIHFLLGPALPAIPGSQYLVAGSSGALSLFPVCPWLTMAVLGARASREKPWVNLAMAAVFAAFAALFGWDGKGQGAPVKFPMNMSYATLSCAAVGSAFAVAHFMDGLEPVRRAARWLGARWLVFFYVHFAVVFSLDRSALSRQPLVVWSLLAIGSLAGTWLVAAVLSPLKPWFREPGVWVALLGVILAAGSVRSLTPLGVAVLAGAAGLVFAAQYGALASCVANARLPAASRSFKPTERSPASSSRLWPDEMREPSPEENLGRNLVRLGVVLAVFASPEILQWVMSRVLPEARSTSDVGPTPLPRRARPQR